jgi:tRNA-dihydrouridine synthase
LVDLNLGCPQRIAFSGHFGSYLLGKEDRVLVLNIVKTVSSQLSIPMFVKIRLLDTIEDSIELCFQLAKAGASLIAIHARYRVNLVGRTGPGARDGAAHLDQVKMIKESFTNSEFSHVPIITNGNVVTSDDVIKNLEMTRANGIMSAEGLLDNPTLFAPFMTAQSDHSKYLSVSKLDLALEYIELVEKYPTNMKPIIFHIRRMCRDDLTKYELLEACINANHPSEVKNIILKMKQYEKEGGFELDKNRILKAKEAMEKLKRQENHRKEYEKRMMRKAKREGKELDYYLRIGAELPSIQRLQELRNMTREESFSIWKQLHLQHCYAYHIHHHEGMKKCDRDRTCAFLHMDPSYSDEKEIYG